MSNDFIKTVMTTAFATALCVAGLDRVIHAQTTTFTYQGKLTDRGVPATGRYDLSFKLFDLASGGPQIGHDVVRDEVPVMDGVFTVDLDFGASPFAPAPERYLEIGVRPGATTGAYVTLGRRQPITNSPYSVETIRATSAVPADDALPPEGVAAPPFVRMVTAGVADPRPPRARPANYIFEAGDPPAGRRVPEESRSIFRRAAPPLAAGLGQVSLGEYRVHVITPFNLGLRVQTDMTGGQVASFGGVGDFSVDAPGIVGGRLQLKENGRLGIGTSNPSSRLHVRVPASASPISAMTVDVDSFSTFGNAQASHFFRVRDIGANGPSAFMIRGDGNVGLGTDDPEEKLTVTGAVQSTSGGFKFPDGTTQTTAENAVWTTINNTIANEITPTGGSWASVLHLNVPPGRYMLLASIMFWNGATFAFQDNSRSWSCRFSGDDPGGYYFTLGGNNFMTAALHAPVFVTSGGVDVECLAFNGAADRSYIFPWTRRLTAVKLEGLLNNLIY